MSVLGSARRLVGQLLFERRYGVRTAELIKLERFGLAGDERVYYVPANWTTLRKTLKRGDVGPDDVFIDFGAGMGRMVLEATRLPFKRVIGVELSPELHQISRENLVQTTVRRRCADVELVCSDVLDYDIPDDVSVVFFNNPFRGSVFESVIKRLLESVDSAPRPVRVIYYNPAEAPFLESTGRFRLVGTYRQSWRSRGEGPFGITHVYEITP